MTSTSNLYPKNLFTLTTSKFINTRSSCQICNRFLYSFEEVFYCSLSFSLEFLIEQFFFCYVDFLSGRLCQSAYHWRCLKREASSFYDDNTHFICEKCSDMMTLTTTSTSSTSRMTNSGLRIKSSNSSEDLSTTVPNNKSNQENNVVQAIRYFEEKQQRSSQSSNILYARRIRINDYPSSSSETGERKNKFCLDLSFPFHSVKFN